MLRKKIIKRCAQGHEMELSWKRCPRCTGRRPLQVEARDVVDQTMIAEPEAVPVDATRIVTPSVVRSRPPAPIVAPQFVPPPPPPPPSHPAWAGPPANPSAPAHPAWAGPPAMSTPRATPVVPESASPAAPAPPARIHPSWAGPSASPQEPAAAPAHPAWASPASPPPAVPAAPPEAASPVGVPTAEVVSPVPSSPPAPEPEPEVADRSFFEREAEAALASASGLAPPPLAIPELSRDLSVRSRAKLECIGGPLKGRLFMLSSGAYRLGKAPRDLPDSKPIVIAGDRFLSKDHAVILVEPNEIVLTDPGSTNGCFVNGNKITHAALENGDEIRLGESLFRFTKLGS